MDVFELFAKLSLDSSEYEDGLADAENKGSGFGKGLVTAAKVGAAAVGAATTATMTFAKSAIDAGSNFDSSMSQVAATMGKTTDEISDLRDFAQEMGSTTMFSASQAADALNYMALAGYDANTSMEMLPNVLNLAAAGGMQLAAASDMVTDAQSALGLQTEDMSGFVDKLAQTASKSNTSVSQLGEAILTIGATARTMSGGTTELATVLGVLADNGIKGAEGGTHLRNAILSLQTPTKAGTEALQALGMTYNDMYDSAGNMRALPEIFMELQTKMEGMDQQSKDLIVSGIFNKGDLAAVNALLGTESERWNELSTAIDGAWYTSTGLEKAFDEVIGYTTTFDDFTHSFEQLGISAETVQWGLDVAGGSAEMFADMILEAADAGVTLDDVYKAMPMDIDELQMAFDGAAGAASQMADTQMGNLAGDITYFKSALEGVQIAVSDQLTPSLREFVQFGTDGLSQLTSAFKEGGIEGAMDAFGDILADGLNMIIEKLPDFINAGMQLLGALGQGLLDNMPVIVDSAVQIINQLVEGLLSATPNLIQGLIDLVIGLGNGIAELLPTMIPAWIQALIDIIMTFISNADAFVEMTVNIITAFVQGIINALPILIEALPQIFDAVITAILDNLPIIIDAIIQLIGALVEAILGNLGPIIAAGIQLIVSLVGGIMNALPELLAAGAKLVIELVTSIIKSLPELIAGGIKIIGAIVKGIVDTIGNVIEAIAGMIKAIIDTIGSFISSIFETGVDIVTNIKDGISSLGKNAAQWGKDLIDNFVQGIKDKINAVKDAVKNIAQTIKDFLGFSEPEEGPLSNFHTFAPDMMDLFAHGVQASATMLQNTVADAFDFRDIIEEENKDATLSIKTRVNDSDIGYNNIIAANAAGVGDITIPVYIGQELIDTVVVSALQRSNYKSGGR